VDEVLPVNDAKLDVRQSVLDSRLAGHLETPAQLTPVVRMHSSSIIGALPKTGVFSQVFVFFVSFV